MGWDDRQSFQVSNAAGGWRLEGGGLLVFIDTSKENWAWLCCMFGPYVSGTQKNAHGCMSKARPKVHKGRRQVVVVFFPKEDDRFRLICSSGLTSTRPLARRRLSRGLRSAQPSHPPLWNVASNTICRDEQLNLTRRSVVERWSGRREEIVTFS